MSITRSLVAALVAASLLALAPAAAGDTVAGRVVDDGGVGVAGVELDFGGGVVPVNPLTDPLGSFNVTVPAGTYDIELLPPSGTDLLGLILESVTVAGTVNLGVLTLQTGYALTGTLVDVAGAPVVNGDIDVFDVATGDKLDTPGDGTDATGAFEVLIPSGNYDVRMEPPLGRVVVTQVRESVVVAGGPVSLGTVVLPPGVLLSGTVRDAVTLAPLAGIDIDVEVESTGAPIETPRDDTDAFGRFTVVVPAGTLALSFDPPAGDAHVGLELRRVRAPAATDIGFVDLEPGVTLSGTVRGPGGIPVAGADIDVDTLAGRVRVRTPRDDTNGSGSFSVIVPLGAFSVIVQPSIASGLVARRIEPVLVTGPTVLPTVSLAAGLTLSGTVDAGWLGLPERGCEVDAFDAVTGLEIPTPGSSTDGAGAYAIVVPAGTVDVTFQPHKGSQSRAHVVAGQVVAGPVSLPVTLSRVPLYVHLDDSASGFPQVVAPGEPIRFGLTLYNPTSTAQPALATLEVVGPFGTETAVTAGVPVTLPPGFLRRVQLAPVLVLPFNPANAGLRHRLRMTLTDPATAAVIDRDEIDFVP